jgi:hypothetical protein
LAARLKEALKEDLRLTLFATGDVFLTRSMKSASLSWFGTKKF